MIIEFYLTHEWNPKISNSGKSEHGNNSNIGILHILQSSRTGASLSDHWRPHLGHSSETSYPSAGMQSTYSKNPSQLGETIKKISCVSLRLHHKCATIRKKIASKLQFCRHLSITKHSLIVNTSTWTLRFWNAFSNITEIKYKKRRGRTWTATYFDPFVTPKKVSGFSLTDWIITCIPWCWRIEFEFPCLMAYQH